MTIVTDETMIFQLWQDFFTVNNMINDIRTLADNYPEKRSLIVDYSMIFKTSGDLAETLLDNPESTLRMGADAISYFMEPDQKVSINLRVKELYKTNHIPIRQLRAENLTKFICIEGLVKKVTEVRPKLLTGVFVCNSCGFRQEISQDLFHFSEPLECSKDSGGCGKKAGSTSFKFIVHESNFIDSQKIEIQEYLEGLKGGDQPQKMNIFFEDDSCGKISPGEKITITGILKVKQKREGQIKTTSFDLFIDGNWVESSEHLFEEMDLTPQDINEITILSQNPKIFSEIIRSIAPSIFGLDNIKRALTLQLFGGVLKENLDNSKTRGDIHVLLVGDPGTAKSQLLMSMSKLAPRGVFTSGKSTSAAGLTAAVVKDDFGEGRYTLEAGVMVLSDKGLACIDEMDKMTESDRSAMHEAMEQQTVSIAKAGIQATLQSRCSVLGAANPKHGRFRLGQAKHEQINLPPPLRSRFDLIFTITDQPDNKRDRELAESVLRTHRLGELKQLEKMGDKTLERMREAGDSIFQSAEPKIKQELLRKYVAYSKRNYFPVLSKEATDEIVDFYVSLRERSATIGGDEAGSIALTARQLEALVRLAEASARILLKNEVTKQDARIAIELMEDSLKDIALTETGTYDIDGIMGSGFKSQKDKMYEIFTIIKEYQLKEGRITKNELAAKARDRNIDERELENYLKKLQDEGSIFEPRTGEYSIL